MMFSDRIRPMLVIAGKPFSSEGWLFEPKFDGIRCLAWMRNGVALLRNRRLTPITNSFPEIVEALHDAAGSDCILDGEIVVMKGNKEDRSSLQSRMVPGLSIRTGSLIHHNPAQYVVFDILEVSGKSLIHYSLRERKEVLSKVLHENKSVVISHYIEKYGEMYFEAAVQTGFEGVIAKRLDSPYLPATRSNAWVKFRRSQSYDFVVGGYTRGQGRREKYFGALLLGAYARDGNLVYVGRAGSGFSREEAASLCSRLEKATEPGFLNPPVDSAAEWTLPNVVVEVEALGATRNAVLRFPVFIRIRDDKTPEECLFSQLTL